jgi:hypothetical protein
VHSDVALDWGFAPTDGSRFTDPRRTPWREAAKQFLWTLRVDSPAGHRRARDSTLVKTFQHLRVLIRSMAGEGYCRFADLDRDAAERFWRRSRHGLPQRPSSFRSDTGRLRQPPNTSLVTRSAAGCTERSSAADRLRF